MFETGEVDLCFTASSLEHPGVRELAVLDAEVFLAVPPGHYLEAKESVRLEYVADEPFIEYKAGHPFRKINLPGRGAYCRLHRHMLICFFTLSLVSGIRPVPSSLHRVLST